MSKGSRNRTADRKRFEDNYDWIFKEQMIRAMKSYREDVPKWRIKKLDKAVKIKK